MLKLITPPAMEPITLPAAKNHLRLEVDDDDDLVLGLIAAARELIESWTWRSLITTGWRLTLDEFGMGPHCSSSDWLRLPLADVIAVSSVGYVDLSGTTLTMDPGDYHLAGAAPG